MTKRNVLRIILAVIGVALVVYAAVFYFRDVRGVIMEMPRRSRVLRFFALYPIIDAHLYFSKDDRVPSGLILGLLLFFLLIVLLSAYSFSNPALRNMMLVAISFTLGVGLLIRTIFPK